jgi:glycosyltransferase involved in cell wall biosynthesis
MATARRVTVIAHELRGFRPAGGMGTATAFLALALARLGHSVEILLGRRDPRSIDPYWADLYANAGVVIRPAPRPADPVDPWEFAHAHSVMLGLQDDPPDVVIAHDFGAPAYSALQLRHVGGGFDETLFVVFCHGPRRYVVDLSPNLALGDLRAVLGVSILEQATVELADVVVSPSAFLLDWMRRQGWRLPERAVVIPYLTRAGAAGDVVAPAAHPSPEPIRRLTFFGRVDERKGVKLLAAALNALEPERLAGLELEFVGKTTATWPPERVEALLSNSTRGALRGVHFAGELEHADALDRIGRAGTLVVMPSLQENSPNAVYECLERGIPFLASDVGGVPELIVSDDRPRTLFEATAEGLETALRRVLAAGHLPPPARAAVDASASLARWSDVLALRPQPREIAGDSDESFVLLLGEVDVPADGLRETLVHAQRATGADVVTCGVRLADGTTHLYAGDPGGLGALENAYGNVALVRRELLDGLEPAWPEERDREWPLIAALAASGASIVSIPLALADRHALPGSAEDDPAAALRAVQHLERSLPEPLRGAARLAAGLAADAARERLRDDIHGGVSHHARRALRRVLRDLRRTGPRDV